MFKAIVIILIFNQTSHALIFMRNVAIGNLIALAIPLNTNDPYLSNVFMSYNFESNYGAYTSPADLGSVYLDKFMLPYDRGELDEKRRKPLEGRNLHNNYSKRKQQITRQNVYKIIESYIESSCLMRSICEAAITPLCKYNGIVGDIIHIILSPSTSMHENINPEYYEAEKTGRKERNCLKYAMACPKNLLDLITTDI